MKRSDKPRAQTRRAVDEKHDVEAPGPPHRAATRWLLMAGGLAVALGFGTWQLAPYLLPVQLPSDYPSLPDLSKVNATARSRIESADREARRKPASAEAMGSLGMAYHSNQVFDQGQRAYRIAARLNAGDYRWVYYLALLNEETGNDREEVRYLQQAVRIKPDYVPAALKLADWYFKADRLNEAEHYYQRGIEFPEAGATLQATLGLGRVAVRRQQWSQVVERVTPLLRNYSYVLQPHELLQEAYTGLGQQARAIEARQNMALAQWKVVPPVEDPLSNQLVEVSCSSTRLLKQAGLLSRVGNPDRAVQIARRAAEVEPGDPEVRNFLARTLLTFYGDKSGSVDEALTQLAECLRLRPNDLLPLWGFTDDFFKTPKPPAAVERLRVLVMPHAGVPDAHYSLGLIADARGELDEAAMQYRAAIDNNPKDSAAHNKLGQILEKTGKIDQAIEHLEKAVQLNPLNNGARLNLGIALMQQGSYARALNELGELLKNNPRDAEANFCMGYACMYSKKIDDAIAHFREGLRYKNDDADAHYGLASAFYMQRRQDESRAEVQQALKLRPEFPAAQELLQKLGR